MSRLNTAARIPRQRLFRVCLKTTAGSRIAEVFARDTEQAERYAESTVRSSGRLHPHAVVLDADTLEV